MNDNKREVFHSREGGGGGSFLEIIMKVILASMHVKSLGMLLSFTLIVSPDSDLLLCFLLSHTTEQL